jgi:hypothetical protein
MDMKFGWKWRRELAEWLNFGRYNQYHAKFGNKIAASTITPEREESVDLPRFHHKNVKNGHIRYIWCQKL